MDSIATHALASNIDDSEWEFRLIRNFTNDESPDRIRCGPEGHCWMWNLESIWLADSAGQWRQAYKLPSEERQRLEAIESVSMISPETGWFNTNRMIYQTLDGGTSWRPSPGPIWSGTSGEYGRIFFRNNKVGWLAGAEFQPRLAKDPAVNNAMSGSGKEIMIAKIWQTSDGGSTWQSNELKRLVGRFAYLEFWDDFGVAFGDAGCVFTSDAGKEWKDMRRIIPIQQETGERPVISSGFFVDNDNGWIFTSWFETLTTHDGGKTWKVVSSKPIGVNGSDTAELIPSRIVFVDKSRGLMIAGRAGTGKLFKTQDGGVTWYEIPADERFYDVGWRRSGGFLVGGKGIYSISLKGG